VSAARFALTKLDILDDQPVIKIGVAYLVNGRKIDYYPGLLSTLSISLCLCLSVCLCACGGGRVRVHVCVDLCID